MNKKKLLTTLIKYACCIIPGALISWLVLDQHGFAYATEVDRYRILCDAFTIPGVILIMAGALVWISNLGGFDGIAYSLKIAIKRLIPLGSVEPPEKYFDYVERRKSRRLKGYHFIFITGIGFLAVALFFMYKFYQLY